VQCAHGGCPTDATIRLKLRTGWADLCRHHYEFHIQQEADEFNRAHEFTTREEQREFFKEKLAGFGRQAIVSREPGQDDEERTAT
jgi:hypothetical protein